MWECKCGLEVDDRYEACTYCGTQRAESAKKVNELGNTQYYESDAPVSG